MAVREAEPVETLQEVKEAGLDREDLLAMYRNMVITRGIEERGHILYKQGKVPAAATRPRPSQSRRRWARTTSGRRCSATWEST